MSDGKASELGILNFEFLLRQAAEPSEELCAKAHCELFNFELEEELQFIGGIINELAVTNLGGYGVPP